MLQCVAVCCSVLQCVAVCCSVMQCVAPCCSALQYVAVRCRMLQFVAVRCNALQCAATCCNVLQCVAICCHVLQCGAVCCSVLRMHYLASHIPQNRPLNGPGGTAAETTCKNVTREVWQARHTYTHKRIHTYIHTHTHTYTRLHTVLLDHLCERSKIAQITFPKSPSLGSYEVATNCRLPKNTGLFCKRALLNRLYSAKETCIFKEPTNHSHPISVHRSTECLRMRPIRNRHCSVLQCVTEASPCGSLS